LTRACHFAEFLLHASCVRQVSDYYEDCFHDYQQQVGQVYAKLNVPYRRPAKETSAKDLGTVCW